MMRTLPRYTFRTSSKGGCTVCGDPHCLCDVQIGTPVPIRTDVEHRYWQQALDELDDWDVTERNFVEAASIVLGMFELQRALGDVRQQGNRGPAEWRALPEDVQWNLKYHYRAGTPWRWAQLELEGVDCDLELIGKYYLERRRTASFTRDSSKYAAAKRARRASIKAVKAPDLVECVICGKVVVNTQGKRLTCSDRCRVAKRRYANGAVKRPTVGADND